MNQFHIKSKIFTITAALSGCIGTFSSNTAFAQSMLLEEIKVVAQKREERLQDVGIAISAFNDEQLRASGVRSSADLRLITPGLQVSTAANGTLQAFTIRGVTQNDWSAHQESAVAIYLDERYLSTQAGTDFLLFDLDRVEVLKGPQGTLFGRNATGGLVHFITKKPTDELDGYAEIGYGRFNKLNFEGAVSGGITENLAARLSVIAETHDPIIKNRVGEDLYDNEAYGGRFQLLATPSEQLEILLTAQYAKKNATTGWYENAASRLNDDGEGVFTPGLQDFFGYSDDDGDPYTVDHDFAGFVDIETKGASTRLTWDNENFTFVSITDYLSVDQDYIEDSDASPEFIFNFFVLSDVDQFSQEFRLSGEEDQLNWAVGAYYLNIDGNYEIGADLGPAAGGPITLESDYFNKTESWSLFAQIDYDIAPNLTFSAGFRHIWEKKDFSYQTFFKDERNGADIGGGAYFDFSTDSVGDLAKLNKNLWAAKIGLNWKPTEDTLVYLTFNRGIKGGGFNAPLDPTGLLDPITGAQDNDAMSFGEEKLYAYEAGFKSTIWDQKARISGAVYYYDYKDYQAFNLTGLTQVIFNADAEIYGAELELLINPAEGLDIMLGISVLDATAKDIPIGDTIEDKNIVLAPSIDLSGMVRYEFDITSGLVALQADFSYVGDHYFNLTNWSTVKEEGYFLANARISFVPENSDLEVSAFVNNIANTRYRSVAFDISSDFGMTENYFANPRTWGVAVRYSFN